MIATSPTRSPPTLPARLGMSSTRFGTGRTCLRWRCSCKAPEAVCEQRPNPGSHQKDSGMSPWSSGKLCSFVRYSAVTCRYRSWTGSSLLARTSALLFHAVWPRLRPRTVLNRFQSPRLEFFTGGRRRAALILRVRRRALRQCWMTMLQILLVISCRALFGCPILFRSRERLDVVRCMSLVKRRRCHMTTYASKIA
jgi:hypothetical protein